LDLLPFISLRDFHALRRKNGTNFDTAAGTNHVHLREGPFGVWIRSDSAKFLAEPDWWTGHLYPIETERGQDDVEDLFKPGMFVFKASRRASVMLWASVEDVSNVDWDA